MLKKETNLWDITINDVIKIDTDDGDTILVEMPPQSTHLPVPQLDDMTQRVAKAFEAAFADKDVRILVMPSGMKVQLIKSSKLQDK